MKGNRRIFLRRVYHFLSGKLMYSRIFLDIKTVDDVDLQVHQVGFVGCPYILEAGPLNTNCISSHSIHVDLKSLQPE